MHRVWRVCGDCPSRAQVEVAHLLTDTVNGSAGSHTCRTSIVWKYTLHSYLQQGAQSGQKSGGAAPRVMYSDSCHTIVPVIFGLLQAANCCAAQSTYHWEGETQGTTTQHVSLTVGTQIMPFHLVIWWVDCGNPMAKFSNTL